MIEAIGGLAAAFGLSGSVGLNAYIPHRHPLRAGTGGGVAGGWQCSCHQGGGAAVGDGQHGRHRQLAREFA